MYERIKSVLLKVFVVAVLVVAIVSVAWPTKSTRNPVAVTLGDFGRVLTASGTLAATADTHFIPFKLTAQIDSLILVVHTWRASGTAPRVLVRLEQSMNNSTWIRTTLGTDSTTWAGMGTTEATAKVNYVRLSHVAYGTYPFNRIWIEGANTGANTATASYRVYFVFLRPIAK